MENLNDNDYILYMGQEANFQTRSMLIPAKKFLSVPKRKDDYEVLKKCSIKNYKFDIDKKTYVIKNLLTFNLVEVDKNMFKYEQTEYSKICGELLHYADGSDYCFYEEDEVWYGHTIGNFCGGGFNHIKNYDKFKTATKIKDHDINIIDSFLVLETHDKQIELPPFDTVDEMMKTLY